MDLSIAKRPCDSVTNKDWEMNAFLPENKRHFLPQDTLATKNHSSHFAPNLTLLSFQIRTCADVIQRCRTGQILFLAGLQRPSATEKSLGTRSELEQNEQNETKWRAKAAVACQAVSIEKPCLCIFFGKTDSPLLISCYYWRSLSGKTHMA